MTKELFSELLELIQASKQESFGRLSTIIKACSGAEDAESLLKSLLKMGYETAEDFLIECIKQKSVLNLSEKFMNKIIEFANADDKAKEGIKRMRSEFESINAEIDEIIEVTIMVIKEITVKIYLQEDEKKNWRLITKQEERKRE